MQIIQEESFVDVSKAKPVFFPLRFLGALTFYLLAPVPRLPALSARDHFSDLPGGGQTMSAPEGR